MAITVVGAVVNASVTRPLSESAVTVGERRSVPSTWPLSVDSRNGPLTRRTSTDPSSLSRSSGPRSPSTSIDPLSAWTVSAIALGIEIS